MPYVPQNRHVMVLLLSLLITLFFSLPSLVTMRSDIRGSSTIEIVLPRFLTLLALNFLLVVPLFYANLLGKPALRAKVRYPPVRILMVGAANMVFVILLTGVTLLIQQQWLAEVAWMGRFRGVYLFRNFVILSIVLLTVYIIELFQRSQRMSAENVRLQEENTMTQLVALKAQIHPHFLFNSLNSLASVIRTDRDESLQFVQCLSDVFRYNLRSNQQDLVSVAEELRGLDAYFFMLKARFGMALRLQLRVEEAAYHRKIPPLALQVLVENAVKHNVIMTTHPLTIAIASVGLALRVSNGRQEKKSLEESSGIGLANLNRRYQLIARRSIAITRDQATFTVTLPLL